MDYDYLKPVIVERVPGEEDKWQMTWYKMDNTTPIASGNTESFKGLAEGLIDKEIPNFLKLSPNGPFQEHIQRNIWAFEGSAFAFLGQHITVDFDLGRGNKLIDNLDTVGTAIFNGLANDNPSSIPPQQ